MEQQTPARPLFQDAYVAGTAPWVIGEPQPAVVALERGGGLAGSVLDLGCGTGEHTMLLASLEYDVLGVDAAPAAIEQARSLAAARGVTARFEVADAMDLGGLGRFDTVLDSALFHIFGAEDRGRYVRALGEIVAPGGRVVVLALSTEGPGFGPQVSHDDLRQAFGGAGWTLEDLAPSTYRGVVTHDDQASSLGVPLGEKVDLPAWLARVRRGT